MNNTCKIKKKKVILCYIILGLVLISAFIAMYSPIFVVVVVGLFTLSYFIGFKYLSCSNCGHLLRLGDLPYYTTKYCSRCGSLIEYE